MLPTPLGGEIMPTIADALREEGKQEGLQQRIEKPPAGFEPAGG